MALQRYLETTSLEDFLFYCAFIFFSFAEILSSTAFVNTISALGYLCTALLYCSVAMLLIRLAILRASHFQWVVVLLICALAGVLYKLYGLQYPLWIFLFVVSGKDVDLKLIARITLALAGVLTFITIMSCYIGIIENYTMLATDTRAVRNSMGFSHPNRLGERMAEICIAYWYLHAEDKKVQVFLLCFVSALYVNAVSNSRTSCLVFAALIFAMFFYPLILKMPRLSIFVSVVFIAFVVVASFYLMAGYNPANSFMYNLNNLLTGRLHLMNVSYKYAAPSLFGNDYSNAPIVAYSVATDSQLHFLVDNAYAHLVLRYGIVATVLFFVLILLVYYRCFRRQSYSLALLGLTVLLLVGFVENFTLDIQYNYFLFLICGVVWAKERNSAPNSERVRSLKIPEDVPPVATNILERRRVGRLPLR